MNEKTETDTPVKLYKSHEVYSKQKLQVYDLMILGFSSRFVWKCPKKAIIQHYNKYVSSNHLDAGVGTGYFLDKCKFPKTKIRLGLMDLNPNCLDLTRQRLIRYNPEVFVHDIQEEYSSNIGLFDSIGLTNVLHCIPGYFEKKGIIISNLKSMLNKDGVLFGSTLLCIGVKGNVLSKYLIKKYNEMGIMSNQADTKEGLENILNKYFIYNNIKIIGSIALFVASDIKQKVIE